MDTQKGWATIIGIILMIFGVAGFFMSSPLFGIFGVNTAHNTVHLITGAIFLWAGLSRKAPVVSVNKWLGVIYLIIGVIGFFGALEFLEVMGRMDYDNWLHVVIGVVSAAIGWFVK